MEEKATKTMTLADGRTVEVYKRVNVTKLPPGPKPEDDGFDTHQFDGWRGLLGNALDVDQMKRGGTDPLTGRSIDDLYAGRR